MTMEMYSMENVTGKDQRSLTSSGSPFNSWACRLLIVCWRLDGSYTWEGILFTGWSVAYSWGDETRSFWRKRRDYRMKRQSKWPTSTSMNSPLFSLSSLEESTGVTIGALRDQRSIPFSIFNHWKVTNLIEFEGKLSFHWRWLHYIERRLRREIEEWSR